MEIIEYIKIFKKQYKIFLMTVIGIIVIGVFIQAMLPTRYKADVNLNITRIGYQKNTNNYRYDEFYRLQADEKFADTVVRWIGSKKIQTDISDKLKNIDFEKLKARRLSSQMISVTFLVSQPGQAGKVVEAMKKVLNNQTEKLNQFQRDPNWFKVLVNEPVIFENKLSFGKLIFILLIAGIFIGFWTVYIKHYFSKTNS